MKNKINYLFSLIGIFTICSCTDYLDVKSDYSVVIPSKVSDYQAMLDRASNLMNARSPFSLMMIGAEEFEVESAVWHAFPIYSNLYQQKFGYIWADDIYNGDMGVDWNSGYARILELNIVLDGLTRMPADMKKNLDWKTAYGSALFRRSRTFYNLAQAFCKPYDITKLEQPGLPLRLESDVTIHSTRATLGETYDQIIGDMLMALDHLPYQSEVTTRPSKVAAYGFLAQAHLQMGEYEQALSYVNQALDMQSDLIDFAELDVQKDFPFEDDFGSSNKEIVYFEVSTTVLLMHQNFMHVSADLLDLYTSADLRMQVFFNKNTAGKTVFRGDYTGGLGLPFTGIYTGELYLIKAECEARLGRDEAALTTLNTLLENRFNADFEKVSGLGGENLLSYILDERRRELCFKGSRWNDLRRLNNDPRFAVTIRREIDGQIYELLPNSPKYVWPIPDEVIKRTGMVQNPR